MKYCPTGKKQHRGRKQALGAAAITEKREGKPIRAYRCGICKKWHLTSRLQIVIPPRHTRDSLVSL